VARLAIESGLFPVIEAEYGDVTRVRPIRHRVPVEEYLRIQSRYKHLFEPTRRDDVIAAVQAIADRNIDRYAPVGEPS
jgi:pyruvate ferredoxin oxidoreductase beta subunit